MKNPFFPGVTNVNLVDNEKEEWSLPSETRRPREGDEEEDFDGSHDLCVEQRSRGEEDQQEASQEVAVCLVENPAVAS